MKKNVLGKRDEDNKVTWSVTWSLLTLGNAVVGPRNIRMEVTKSCSPTLWGSCDLSAPTLFSCKVVFTTQRTSCSENRGRTFQGCSLSPVILAVRSKRIVWNKASAWHCSTLGKDNMTLLSSAYTILSGSCAQDELSHHQFVQQFKYEPPAQTVLWHRFPQTTQSRDCKLHDSEIPWSCLYEDSSCCSPSRNCRPEHLWMRQHFWTSGGCSSGLDLDVRAQKLLKECSTIAWKALPKIAVVMEPLSIICTTAWLASTILQQTALTQHWLPLHWMEEEFMASGREMELCQSTWMHVMVIRDLFQPLRMETERAFLPHLMFTTTKSLTMLLTL